MVGSLTRRIARIEATLPRPTPPPRPWWEEAPPALLAYLATLPTELFDDPALRPRPVAGRPDLLAYSRMLRPSCAGLAVLDGLQAELCSPGPLLLPAIQRTLLSYGWHTLLDAHKAALPPGTPASRAIAASWERMHGAPWSGYRYFDDLSGRSWLALWRASGTRDPETLALMEFGPAELAPLAAEA